MISLSRSQRLCVIIAMSGVFFLGEISAGFYTGSLALVADAFHHLNDLIGFIVALIALRKSQHREHPKQLSFGWQRAQVLGAFFNGVFLLALGVSIFLQSIERFIAIREVQNPEVVLVVGAVGFGLNVVSAFFVHEHSHEPSQFAGNGEELQPKGSVPLQENQSHAGHVHTLQRTRSMGRDYGMMGVFLHVVGDAANNVGVIIAAAIIWRAKYQGRFYADPGVSMGIAILILISSLPLVKKTGSVLLESVPLGVNTADVHHDLMKIPEIISVHELHVWRLNQEKSLASTHITVPDMSISKFTELARTINECFHAYGMHSSTIQPELCETPDYEPSTVSTIAEAPHMQGNVSANLRCRIGCGPSCNDFACCT